MIIGDIYSKIRKIPVLLPVKPHKPFGFERKWFEMISNLTYDTEMVRFYVITY